MSDAENEIIFSTKYKPLFLYPQECRYCVVTGGRGSGKSFAVSCAVTNDEYAADYNILYLRQTLVSADKSIIPEYWEKAEMMGVSRFLERRTYDIYNPRTGYSLWFKGVQVSKGSNEAQLKSLKRVGLTVLDEAQELVDEAVFDRIDLSMREKGIHSRFILSLNPTDTSHWIYRRFFQERGVADDYNGVFGDTCYIHTTYEDNRRNLDPEFLRLAEECRQNDPEKYRNIFLGFWRGEVEGALWTREMIEAHRVATVPGDLDRIVVAIDPAVTSTDQSDETGIVVAGRRRERGETHYYIITDRSIRATPATWAKAAIEAYNEYQADRIVAEVNQGGDMVRTIITQAAGRVPFTAVHATRGKLVRAEPIAALYERGLVHHVGTFGALEDEMRTYVGRETQRSPDRMDALVWALTELSQKRGSGVVG